MTNEIKLIVYPVMDVAAAKTVFGKFLGAEPYADGPYYVGYKTDELEIGLDPKGHSIVCYIEVDDITGTMQALIDSGATLHQDIKDVGGGMLIAQVRDENDNVLGLRQLPK